MATTGEVLGTKNKNLILETAGKLYIKVNDRYYDIDFRNLSSGNLVGKKVQTIQEKLTQAPIEELDLSEYVTSESLKKELKKYVTERSFQDVMETQEALQDAKLQGFTEAITPITIQTMSIAVGQDQLQFDIIQKINNTIPGDYPLYIDNNEESESYGSLKFKPCCIKHYTLDGPSAVSPSTKDSEYWRWYILNTNQENSIETIYLENTTYYVYMVIPYKELGEDKTGLSDVRGSSPYTYLTDSGESTEETIGANIYADSNGNIISSGEASGVYYKTGIGYLKVSEESIAYDEYINDGYYHLLYAIITNADGDPSWTTMNGFTEISPGQIRAYLFSNADGTSFLDLRKSEFQLTKKTLNSDGETVNDVVFHFDPDNGLTLKGKITVLGDSSWTDSEGNEQSFIDWNKSILNKITNVQDQIDGAIESWYYEGPPSAEVDPERNWLDPDIREAHVGDLYYDNKSGKAYRYMGEGSGTESDPRKYIWVLIVDTDITKALADAANAQSTADSKVKMFTIQPNPPYSSGDLWITDQEYEYTNDLGATISYSKGELLVCGQTITEGKFSWGHWSLATHYTDDSALDAFMSGTFKTTIESLEGKIDDKIDVYSQEDDPSENWTDDSTKASHIGDIWLNTGSDTENGVEPGQSAIWDGSKWSVSEVPKEIYDLIDGKKQIFVTQGENRDTPPSPPYEEGDLWVKLSNSEEGVSDTNYSETYVCIKSSEENATKGNADHWVPASDAKDYINAKYNELDKRFRDYDYLREALKGTTEIEGGLVLTSLIGLGTWEGEKFKLMSGINGQIDSEIGGSSIASWYGGLMLDRESIDKSSEEYSDSAKTLFRHDGSGYLASGNISFTSDGTLNFGTPTNGVYNLSIDNNGVVSIGGNMKISGDNPTDINGLLNRLSEIENNIKDWFTLENGILTTKYTLVSNMGFASAVSSSASGGIGGLIFDGDYDIEWDESLYSECSMSARLGKIMWDAIKNKVSTPSEIFGSSAIGDSTTFMYWDGSSLKASKLGTLAFSDATIPTSTSDLTNNSDYITSSAVSSNYVKKTGDTITGDLLITTNLNVSGVSTLPTIKIGSCTITYDSSNECLKFTF